MKQYQELLQKIISDGTWKSPARTNLPRTKSLFGTRMEFDMKDGFPLLTTKKMYYKGIITELLWFLKGGTNIKYLIENDCNIWNQDAYRWYLKNAEYRGIDPELTLEEFIDAIKNTNYDYNPYILVSEWVNGHWDSTYKLGDLGKVYGHQWRNQNGVDQLKTVIDRLNTDPMGRYAILDAWNPSDFNEMALPPCHLLYQFNCREIPFWDRVKFVFRDGAISTSGNLTAVEEELNESNVPKYYLDLQMYQRSVDTCLGNPYNIASASLLLHIIAKVTNMVPSKFVWIGGDTHIYENHLDLVDGQLLREPLELCTININKQLNSLEDLENLSINDIVIENYKSHSAIKYELKTGL